MKNLKAIGLGLITVLILAGIYLLFISQPQSTIDDIYGVSEVHNLHLIDEDTETGFALYRMGQPSADDMEGLCILGITEMVVLAGSALENEMALQEHCPTLTIAYNVQQDMGEPLTSEFLTYFDYFARLEYGDNYLTTNSKAIGNHLQHVVYAINQPAAARGYQSVFWNISIFDQHYFSSMFGEFVFPDFSKPNWQTVDSLQHFFLNWLNKEREKSVLTFPVVTAALLTENGFDVKSSMLEGNIYDSLMEYKIKSSVDMLVMGAFSHSKIAHVFLGSNTLKMIENTNLPLVILR